MLRTVELLIAIAGILLPGYLMARCLGLRSRHAWLAAFPFSALILVEIVIHFTIFHLPLRSIPVYSVLIIIIVVCTYFIRTGRAFSTVELPEFAEEGCGVPGKICLGFSVLLVFAVLYRSVSYPLSGYDTFFRWENLARLILQHESLDFYPPITPQDFAIYLIPDGIPPLVASVYWWFYAATNEPIQQYSAISEVLQLISAMGLTFYAAYYSFGLPAAWFSLAAFSSSALLIEGFTIGQETGFTALAVAGQFCFASVARRRPGSGAVIAAAMFAALGALARDYGPALSCAGLLVLALDKNTRRFLWLYMVTTLLLSSPWYLRDWVHTGNPLYPHGIPGGFAINEIYVAMQNSFHEKLAFYRYNFLEWCDHVGEILIGAPVAIVGVTLFRPGCRREHLPFIGLTLLVVILWLISMGDTAGGPHYSMRVLTPAFVSLTILAGAVVARLYAGDCSWLFRGLRWTTTLLIVTASVYSLSSALAHPFSPRYLLSAITYSYSGPPELAASTLELAKMLERSDVTATGVLTTDPYLGTNLLRETKFRPVMVWSPDVKFVFDHKLDPREIQRRLIAMNIRIVCYSNDDMYTPFLNHTQFFRMLLQQAPIGGAGDEALYYLNPEGSVQ
ncbi:MAG: hypothetical protein HXX17_10530 [Geobacteraceae bacterium]|nr:hypothetical protein [Geobacteraceae bacterium]